MSRVRSSNPVIGALIREAAARSTTFRGLVERIDASDGMVYVAEGNCGSGVRACLLLTLTMMGPNRLLRILVDARAADRDLMASIGHELQHAVEVLNYRSVSSSSEMILLYKRICDVCGRSFETNAAIRTGNMIRGELSQRTGRSRDRTEYLPVREWPRLPAIAEHKHAAPEQSLWRTARRHFE
jgi:hypothetical protein